MEMILGLPQEIASLGLGFWDSVASILGLFGILFTTWRLSKVKKIVEEDRFRIAETMKPFDLYFNLQKTLHILRQQQNNHLIAQEEKEKAGILLKGLTEVETCLRQYFREAHCIRKIRANSYVDAGHLFLVKDQPEEAKDYYEKALIEAKACNNKKDISECLQGLKVCSALLEEDELFDEIDGKAEELGVPMRLRDNRFLTGVRRAGYKTSIKMQMRVRRYRKGTSADPGRVVVQIRSSMLQYEEVSNEAKVIQRSPDELSSTGRQPEALSQPAAREPNLDHRTM